MNTDLQGHVIIVTGAASGIGRGIAAMCKGAGATVVGLDHAEDGVDRMTAAGHEAELVDVADVDQFSAAIMAAYHRHGRLDGLVNNAGVTLTAPFLDASVEMWEKLWQVNQRSVLVGCQAAARVMTKAGQGGAIVNIASNHAQASDAGYEAYAATKGAITAMTRAMAWSLGPKGIRVNALCPGLTLTEAVSAAASDPARAAEFEAWHATGQVNTVEDVGRAAVFLLSPASAALSGSEIVADQGMASRLADLKGA